MSDYEIAYLSMEAQSSMSAMYMNYMSIVIAFLLAAYFASQNLTRSMAVLVTGLYSLVLSGAGIALHRTSSVFFNLIAELRSRAGEGSETLAWHPAQNTPEAVLTLGLPGMVLAMLFAYGGSLVYFFSQRTRPAVTAAQ